MSEESNITNPQKPLDPMSLWLDALRSGEYVQGKFDLNSHGKFCCLGVACELYQKHVGGLNAREDELPDGGVRIAYSGFAAVTPPQVVEWLGLYNDLGAFFDPIEKDDEKYHSLSSLNDSGKFSFCEIADIIESRPKGLFIE